jgi:transcriptional regulator with GAF, ATPase, and Fis domain
MNDVPEAATRDHALIDAFRALWEHKDLLGGPANPREPGMARTMAEAEHAHILATLAETRWVLSGRSGAAPRLGMNRSTLQFRMKKLGIMRPTT